MTSSRLLKMLLIVMMTWKVCYGDEKVCLQCATLNVRENWASTGLPIIPSGLKWDKECAAMGATLEALPEWRSSNCASSCFEILIPIDGVYGFVRGCHEQFVYDEMKVIMTNNTDVCEVNKVEGYGTIGFPVPADPLTTAYTGTSFVAPVPLPLDGPVWNKKFIVGNIGPDGVLGCSEGIQKTCKSCGAYDGSGSCSASTTGTCKGVYCTKTSGKLNGHSYESRGCSNFNPFAKDVCSWSEQTFNVSTGVDTGVIPARSKRAVSLSFRANQCFCKGDQCNSAPSPTSLLFTLLTVSFLVSY